MSSSTRRISGVEAVVLKGCTYYNRVVDDGRIESATVEMSMSNADLRLRMEGRWKSRDRRYQHTENNTFKHSLPMQVKEE